MHRPEAFLLTGATGGQRGGQRLRMNRLQRQVLVDELRDTGVHVFLFELGKNPVVKTTTVGALVIGKFHDADHGLRTSHPVRAGETDHRWSSSDNGDGAVPVSNAGR